MSYCRFSDADIYLYRTVDGEFVCQLCRLVTHDIEMHTIEEAIEHVKKHLASGDYVPDYVLERLNSELEQLTKRK